MKKTVRNALIYYAFNMGQFPVYCRNKCDVSRLDFHSSRNLLVIDKFRNYNKLYCLLLIAYSSKCKANYTRFQITYCSFLNLNNDIWICKAK